MPVKIRKNNGYQVRTPGGIKAKNTTRAKAESQERLLNAVEHGWKPTRPKGKRGRPRNKVKNIKSSMKKRSF